MSVNSNGYLQLGGNIRNIYILLLLSLSYSQNEFGDGSDGDLYIAEGETFYIDQVKSSIISEGQFGEDFVIVNNESIFSIGDEVLLFICCPLYKEIDNI